MSNLTFEGFEASLAGGTEPAGLTPSLAALWRVARGDWDGAHQLVQDDESAEASWVHAHLHRVEGDAANAGYWYRRAGKAVGSGDLAAERRAITAALIDERPAG